MSNTHPVFKELEKRLERRNIKPPFCFNCGHQFAQLGEDRTCDCGTGKDRR